MTISTSWTPVTRPSATPMTGRPTISGFQSYTWGNAPGTWGSVTDTWVTYGTITTGTTWTSTR